MLEPWLDWQVGQSDVPVQIMLAPTVMSSLPALVCGLSAMPGDVETLESLFELPV
jgi:hypothetical protein